MTDPQPTRTRDYVNHHIDGTRWDSVVRRADDIVIATPAKGGTTWTQTIVAHLLFEDDVFPEPIPTMSVWVEHATTPLDEMLARLEAQSHRRFLKTHLALDGYPFDAATKHVVVCRDGRDAALSFWNHYSNYSEAALERIRARGEALGRPFPRAPKDFDVYWRDRFTRGWFEWERDGHPMWSDLHVMQTWFDARHLPNVRLFHYADMLADTPRAIREMAGFLGIEVDDARVAAIAEAVSFRNMKANADRFAPSGGAPWTGGGATFFDKGVSGRWREELSAENLALYDAAAERALSPACRRWLETGGPPD